jgi:hypothetical protein
MIEESGSVPVANGSGWPKNIGFASGSATLNVNIVYGNLMSENSQPKLYVHEFGVRWHQEEMIS